VFFFLTFVFSVVSLLSVCVVVIGVSVGVCFFLVLMFTCLFVFGVGSVLVVLPNHTICFPSNTHPYISRAGVSCVAMFAIIQAFSMAPRPPPFCLLPDALLTSSRCCMEDGFPVLPVLSHASITFAPDLTRPMAFFLDRYLFHYSLVVVQKPMASFSFCRP